MHQDIDIPSLVRRALASGHTTASLGRAVGLSQPSVSRLATGKTRPPKAMSVALRLVSVVGGSVTVPDESHEVRNAA